MRVALFPNAYEVVLREESSPSTRWDRYRLPTVEEARTVWPLSEDELWVIGELDGRPFACARIPSQGGSLTHRGTCLSVVGRRLAAKEMRNEEYWALNRAYHLLAWDEASRFCGRCGRPTVRSEKEIARRCDHCRESVYPRLSPAVIMAVVREGKLLLAHNRSHRGGMYSVLAGFVEPGETLEQAVSREVYEEAGITVRNVRYFASQPWPFPDSLMVAFTAEYAGGKVREDGREIETLGWFEANNLPEVIPDRLSVARRLIEWFVLRFGDEYAYRAVLGK